MTSPRYSIVMAWRSAQAITAQCRFIRDLGSRQALELVSICITPIQTLLDLQAVYAHVKPYLQADRSVVESSFADSKCKAEIKARARGASNPCPTERRIIATAYGCLRVRAIVS